MLKNVWKNVQNIRSRFYLECETNVSLAVFIKIRACIKTRINKFLLYELFVHGFGEINFHCGVTKIES